MLVLGFFLKNSQKNYKVLQIRAFTNKKNHLIVLFPECILTPSQEPQKPEDPKKTSIPLMDIPSGAKITATPEAFTNTSEK